MNPQKGVVGGGTKGRLKNDGEENKLQNSLLKAAYWLKSYKTNKNHMFGSFLVCLECLNSIQKVACHSVLVLSLFRLLPPYCLFYKIRSH